MAAKIINVEMDCRDFTSAAYVQPPCVDKDGGITDAPKARPSSARA